MKPWLAHYEPGVRATLEYPSVPMHAFLQDAATRAPQQTATIFGGLVHPLGNALWDAALSYQSLNEQANRLANALAALGVKPHDRVALFLPNCPQYIISYFATLKLGAFVVPHNPLYVPRELEFQLNDSGAETIICLSRFYDTVSKARPRTPLKNVIVTNIKEYFPPALRLLFGLTVEKKEGHAVTLAPGDHAFADLIARAPATAPAVPTQPEDTAVLLYTGGTTGVPKAAEITHANLVANVVQLDNWIINSPADRPDMVLTALPLFHSYAMTTCMNLAVYKAIPMVLIPNPRDLAHVLKCIDRHHPTLFPGVPTMYVAINNYPDLARYNLRSIKACISGAAGLPSEVQLKFQELTGARLVEGYGLSEATPVTHANPVFGENHVGTIGLPYPDTDCRIVDIETGQIDVAPGEPGELLIKGPQVMKRYWNKPEETRAALRDGWLHTGDIASMDPDGYFRIVDRKKDMIIAGGYNIYPREIEEVLYQHPKILEAAVAGVADPYRGETVKAYVVLKPGQTATAEDIAAFCREHLASFKRPTVVEFRDTLPKTMVGKVLRRQLVAEEDKTAGPPDRMAVP